VSKPKPVVYLFYGEDDHQIAREVAGLKGKLGEGSGAELDTTHLNGRSLTLTELQAHAATLPFLARRRLVIVEDAISSLRSEMDRARFLEILEQAPRQTGIVLKIPKQLQQNHWLLRWARTTQDWVYIKPCPALEGGEMVRWIQDLAKASGGEIKPQAAALLGSLVGKSSWLASHEISKLLDYVDLNRPVEVDDVEYLFAPVDLEDRFMIFELVDALGQKRSQAAVRLLNKLLQTREPLQIFGMIIRQFRFILVLKEMSGQNRPMAEMQSLLGTSDYVVRKIIPQVNNYKMGELENILRYFLSIDQDIKMGRTTTEVALNTLVVSLTAAH
jgi:DNA polymerase-3 subunit delta